MLSSDDEYRNCSPRSSATFETSVIPGVKNVPNAIAAATTAAPSTKRLSGQGRSAATTIDAISPTVIGTSGP